MLPFNEERVKNSLILPLLVSTGIQPAELEFETTFKIQLGRGVHTIRTKRDQASGRSDILCRCSGRPLFIIELKAEWEVLTDADRRQGLSYARLLDPMAPYVVLSNGVDTKIYNTVTGDGIDHLSSAPISSPQPSLEMEVGLRFEALKHFIGISGENLMAFCESHNRAALSPFRADPNSPLGNQLKNKYIPAAYVRRHALEERFTVYMGQVDRVVFPVIGASGTGKTNTMCSLVESFPTEPILFYSGTLLSGSLLAQIALDFNAVFSAQEAPVALLKKISSVTNLSGRCLTIFLDALDEWESPGKIAELDMIAGLFRRFHLRLVVSCKSSHWGDFLVRKGIRSAVNEAVFSDVPALSEFDAQELSTALGKYSDLLSLKLPTAEPSKAFRNPFNLRVAFEVAYASGAAIEVRSESRDNLRRYLTLKLEKVANAEMCRRLLIETAALMEHANQVQMDEAALRKSLGLGVLDEIPRDLFDHGVLYRYVDESSGSSIGFYYSSIRDYLLACDAHRLQDRISPAERRARLCQMYQTYVGESSALYYFRTGSLEERRDCLNAAYEVDLVRSGYQVVRLLVWDGGAMIEELSEAERARLLSHLEGVLFSNSDSGVVADQVMDVVTRLGVDSTTEEALTRWLCRFGEAGKGAHVFVSHRIADLLGQADTAAQTSKLVALAEDSRKDGYVRRYAIEALGERSVPNRRAVFLKLLCDSDPNVQTWCHGWYSELEDEALRASVFELLRPGRLPHSTQVEVVQVLRHSRLPDTGQQLFEWLRTLDDGNGDLVRWTCRTLAALDYRPAIPEFMRKLRQHSQTELGESLLICLKEMRAKEVLPELLDLLDKESEESTVVYEPDFARFTFFAQTVASFLDEEILRTKLALERRKGMARYVCMMACASFGSMTTEAALISFVLDPTVPEYQRSHVLYRITSSDNYDVGENALEGRRPLSENLRNMFYCILGEHSARSPLALVFLFNHEDDVGRIAAETIRHVPRFNHSIRGGEVPYVDPERLTAIRDNLLPWLESQLGSPRTPPVVLRICLALAELIGDGGTWEVIHTNWEAVEPAIGRQDLDLIEHRLRSEPPPRSSIEGRYE